MKVWYEGHRSSNMTHQVGRENEKETKNSMIILIHEGVDKIQYPFKWKPLRKLVMERTS